MRKFLLALLCTPLLAASLVFAAGAEYPLDKAPDRSRDLPALQNGAKVFVNYCLNCHSASHFRYNRLVDIGLTEQQIKDNLMFTVDKVGEPMTIALRRADAKRWFGTAPPDLTLIARARTSGAGSGSDWMYTYLRSNYRDDSRPTGWNNPVFPNVGMPHVLWELQGEQEMSPDGKLVLAKPGLMQPAEYDAMVADLVGFLTHISEPKANFRKELGIVVLIFLVILFVLSYALKREYWKDIH
jgi:ubiquinol-cytochrome c reductase cytochrome c1 subunit